MATGSSASHLRHPGGPREVTEDTPPDLLEGTMELTVILPSQKSYRMTASRRTPVMDLLIQITTTNKINPGSHLIQVRNEIGRELHYAASTPIGVLDSRTIEIVPKHQVSDFITKSKQSAAKLPSQPFEHTFRLQVHLPKNQLYVMRVGPKILLQEVLEVVCQEKDLDISKYEIRHPVNLDEKLSLTNRLGDYGLQQVRVVSKNSRITSSVSSADILALQLKTNGRSGSQGHLDSAFHYSRSSVGDSSVSSGSAASARGTSPARSDDSRSISPVAILPSKIKLRSSISSDRTPASTSPLQTTMLKKSISSNPLPGFASDPNFKPKKRAPPPPTGTDAGRPLTITMSQPLASEVTGRPPVPKKELSSPSKGPAPLPSTSRSRQSSASDSSGYHEASGSSVLSDQQQELIRKDRALAAAKKVGTGSLSSLHQTSTSKPLGMSTSTSNLTSGLSVSTTSISSTGSRTKRKAPKPPATPTLTTPLEEELPSQPAFIPGAEEGLERKPLEVQVEVHSTEASAAVDLTQHPVEQIETRSPHRSSETLKYDEGNASESTLTRSGSMSGSRSSIASLPPSPPPVEELSSIVVSTNQVSPPLSPAGASSNFAPAPPPVQRRTKVHSSPNQPLPKPRPRTLKLEESMQPPSSLPSAPPALPILPSRPSSGSKSSVSDDPVRQYETPCKFGVKVLPDNALQKLLECRLKNSTGQNVPVACVSRDGSPVASKPMHDVLALDQNSRSNNFPSQIPHRASVTGFDDEDGLEDHLELFEHQCDAIVDEVKGHEQSEESSSSSDSESEDSDVFVEAEVVTVPGSGPAVIFAPLLRAQSDSGMSKRLEEDSISIKSAVDAEVNPNVNQKSLHRWKNVESLELNVEPRLQTEASAQLHIPNQTTNQPPSTNDTKLNITKTASAVDTPAAVGQRRSKRSSKTGSGDRHEEASSGSEASYADSGLPATTTVTPSPVSLEPDVQEHHSDKSLNSSRRSSIHSSGSDHSECWRELLESKGEEQMEKPSEPKFSAIPSPTNVMQNFNDIVLPPEPSMNPQQQSVERTSRTLPSSDSSQPTSEAEDFVQHKKRDSTSSSTSTMLPTKSESFSYKGEFDSKKRRSSATAATNGASSRRLPAEYTSSSDEDTYAKKSVSMQNLFKKEKFKLATSSIAANDADKVKATSLAVLPSLAGGSSEALGDLGNDPNLLETFQVELEQQFEQWKEQFLQRHLGKGMKSMAETSHQIEPPQKLNEDLIPNRSSSPVVPIAIRQSSSSSSSDSEVDSARVDPAIPPLVNLAETVKENVEPGPQEPPRSNAEQEVKKEEMLPTEPTINNGVKEVKIREKPKTEPPAVLYRYSGPPAINMGTWGERPKRSPVAVKEDNDYIMGMGQNEGKQPSVVASRIHGFTGVPPVSPVTVTPKRVSSPSNRWSNIEVKTFDQTSTSSASVLSTWKQRLEENEKETVVEEHRSVSATNTLERPRASTKKPAFTIAPASSTLDRPGKRTPSPLFTVQNPVSTPAPKSPIAPATAALPKEVVIEEAKKSVIQNGPTPKYASTVFGTFNECDKTQKISMEEKKRFFQGVKPELPAKEVNYKAQITTTTYAERKKETISGDSVDAHVTPSISRSTSSCSSFGSFEGSLSRPSSVSMEEKKRFFQGVKPCESPTREVPIPAVNMKSSIATIQRVFGQRNPLQKSVSNSSLASDASSTLSSIGTTARSDAMVTQVIKGKSFTSVRPSSVGNDAPVKVSTGGNIRNVGNTAIITVGAVGAGNVFKQNVEVNRATEDHSIKISINGTNAPQKKLAPNPSAVQLNGGNDIVIEDKPKSTGKTKIKEMQDVLAQQKLMFQPPAAGQALKAVEKRPISLNGSGDSKRDSKIAPPPPPPVLSIKTSRAGSVSSVSSSDTGSVPPTPTSPMEARAGILSAIKNSGGNFCLKKTSSSVLLK